MIDLAIKHLIKEEGLRLHPYQDHLGYWTIGVGHLIDCRKGGFLPPGINCFPISEQLARQILVDDIHKVHTPLSMELSFWNDLSDVRKVCLISMAFQMGFVGLMGFRNMLADMEAGQWGSAANEALNSDWANQTSSRAKRIALAIKSGDENFLL
jgi:lysozyme